MKLENQELEITAAALAFAKMNIDNFKMYLMYQGHEDVANATTNNTLDHLRKQFWENFTQTDMNKKDSDRLEFDYHTNSECVIVFNTEDDGTQKDQICVIPFYHGEISYAEILGEFIADSLNSFVSLPMGIKRYERLKQELQSNKTKHTLEQQKG